MNVSEQYLLKQMQGLAASMSGVPQSGGKDKTGETGSFQDLMNQIGKATEKKETAKEPETKKDAAAEEVEETKNEMTAEQGGEKKEEELKPEQFAANPNAVNLMDLFRPDMVQPTEEMVTELPVEAIGEESVAGPDLALEDQTFQMETGVEANVDAGVSMEQQPETFRETLQETSQPQEERPAENNSDQPEEAVRETSEAPETPEIAPEQKTENTDKPREEMPDLEVKTESDEEPKAEAAAVGQPVFHEVESAPVKVGETYETVDTEKPDMEAKLSDIIQAAVQNGQQKIEIHLTPQNLGSLTIEIAKDANGILQVVIHAATDKTAGLLNNHMDGLQMALRGYSQEEVRIEVQHNDESQQQNFRQADPDGRGNQQNRQQQQEKHEEKDSGEAFIQKLRLGLFGTDEI